MAAKYATPNEMSEGVLGQLTPAQCAERVRELLASKTMLDEVQERRLLLIQMAEHLDWLKSKRDNADSWSSITRMYKVLSDQVERTNINISDISTKLAEDHARFFADAIVLGFEKMVKALSEREEIVLDDEDFQEILEVGASTSHAYLEGVTAHDSDA